jgi:hypothetical protein
MLAVAERESATRQGSWSEEAYVFWLYDFDMECGAKFAEHGRFKAPPAGRVAASALRFRAAGLGQP